MLNPNSADDSHVSAHLVQLIPDHIVIMKNSLLFWKHAHTHTSNQSISPNSRDTICLVSGQEPNGCHLAQKPKEEEGAKNFFLGGERRNVTKGSRG